MVKANLDEYWHVVRTVGRNFHGHISADDLESPTLMTLHGPTVVVMGHS